jgi:hypothetical protein
MCVVPGVGRKKRWIYNGLAVLLLLAATSVGRAQEFNPPYPRFGITTFSGQTYASPEILKDFDIIAITPNNEMARKYKEKNPNVILLASAALLVSERMRLSGVQLPEAWFYHDISGKRFELWVGSYQMNVSPYCPKVDMNDGRGPVTYKEFASNWLQNNVDFTLFDGTWHDWWWPSPGWAELQTGDFNNNGIADKDEWGGIDSVDAVWWRGINDYHRRERQIPGLKYVVVQLGGIHWPDVNGAVFEDWPMSHGPFVFWISHYDEAHTTGRLPTLNIFDGAHRFFHLGFPVEPYKNNYRSVRYDLSSCLLTSSFFYVDEGSDLGHHANVHVYDEFEAKGQLGYPRTDPIKLPGKPLSSTPYASGVWVRFFDHGLSIVNATGRTQSITASELSALDPIGGSSYYRIQGGQDPDFNNGREVTDSDPLVLWGDTHIATWPDPEVFGDGSMLFRTRKVLVTPIVVDNHVNNQTSPGSDPVQYTGGWVLSSDGDLFYAFYTGRNYAVFQPDGFAWSPPGNGENVATYVPTIGLPGMYEVFEWHGYRGNSPTSFPLSSNVPAKITFNSGRDTTLAVDQTRNFGKWNSLGTYLFLKGKSGKVEISNKANGIVISDAIRFVYKGPSTGYDSTPPSPPRDVRVNQVSK